MTAFSCAMRTIKQRGFPFPIYPPLGAGEERCREETANQQPIACPRSRQGPAQTGASMALSPPHAHLLGAPGCRCWLDPLSPCWGVLRQDLVGPLPLRTPKHCTEMDWGCLLFSFLEVVVFSPLRMTTLCQVSTEALPISCCLLAFDGATTLLALGFVLFFLFTLTLSCGLCIHASCCNFPPLNICSGFVFFLFSPSSSPLCYLSSML